LFDEFVTTGTLGTTGVVGAVTSLEPEQENNTKTLNRVKKTRIINSLLGLKLINF
jgi:hypothetical protein